MTYLEMVNNVLLRMRERPVSSVNENNYSSLIGILVNDSLREVQNTWDWSADRITVSGTTTAGLFSYELNLAGNNITTLNVVNQTSDWFLEYKEAEWFTDQFLNRPVETGAPRYYSFNGVSPDGDTKIDLYPVPDGEYEIYYNIVSRTQELINDDDYTTVPNKPILYLAYAKAVEERGEDGGAMSNRAYLTAQQMLADEIAYDAAKHPEETIWREV